MKKLTTQSGFAIIPILLLAVIIGLVGFVGWRVYDMQQSTKTNTSVSVNTQNQTAEAPITTKADVEKEQAKLDDAAVDTDLDTTALDQDLDSLL